MYYNVLIIASVFVLVLWKTNRRCKKKYELMSKHFMRQVQLDWRTEYFFKDIVIQVIQQCAHVSFKIFTKSNEEMNCISAKILESFRTKRVWRHIRVFLLLFSYVLSTCSRSYNNRHYIRAKPFRVSFKYERATWSRIKTSNARFWCWI